MPNSTAAPIKADTIEPIVNTAKIVLKLSPIRAAKAYRKSCSCDLLKLSCTKAKASMANKGAKITIHFVTPVKKKANNCGLRPTNRETTILIATATLI